MRMAAMVLIATSHTALLTLLLLCRLGMLPEGTRVVSSKSSGARQRTSAPWQTMRLPTSAAASLSGMWWKTGLVTPCTTGVHPR